MVSPRLSCSPRSRSRSLGAVAGVDSTLHERLHALGAGHPAWLVAMHALTYLGDTVTVVCVDIAAVVVCLLRHRRRTAVLVAVTGLLVWGVRVLVMNLIARPRPLDKFWSADGYAFPSGHTTNSAAMLALALVALWPYLRTRLRRVGASAGAAILALAVGASRLAGGVHWPTDVLGGWLLSAALVTLVLGLSPRCLPSTNRSGAFGARHATPVSAAARRERR